MAGRCPAGPVELEKIPPIRSCWATTCGSMKSLLSWHFLLPLLPAASRNIQSSSAPGLPRGVSRPQTGGPVSRYEQLMTQPACWRWKVPGAAEAERLQDRLQREQLEWTPDPRPYPDESLRWILMAEMHKDRCAVCGYRYRRLFTDHDHETGLIRGFLCPSCNTNEGYSKDSSDCIFGKYRAIHPALMCGVRRMYSGGWSSNAIEPSVAPDPVAPICRPFSYSDEQVVSILAAAVGGAESVTAADARAYAEGRADLLARAAGELLKSGRGLDLAQCAAGVRLLVEAGADESLIDGWLEMKAQAIPAA